MSNLPAVLQKISVKLSLVLASYSSANLKAKECLTNRSHIQEC